MVTATLLPHVFVSRRRKSDNDMHYQALQAEYSEGLLARQVRPGVALPLQAVFLYSNILQGCVSFQTQLN